MRILNQEKLMAFDNETFVKLTNFIEMLPITFDNKMISDGKTPFYSELMRNLRDCAFDYIESTDPAGPIDLNAFKNQINRVITGQENPDTSYRIAILTNNPFPKNETINREKLIDLFSHQWQFIGFKIDQNFDKQVFIEGKSSIDFKNIVPENTVITNESNLELATYVQNRFGIESIYLNPFENQESVFNKLLTLNTSFETIARELNIDAHHIGFGKLNFSLGVLNEDVNGWMSYHAKEDATDGASYANITLTQKANETIIIHEWMHFFDLQMQNTPDILKNWSKISEFLLEDNYKKNKFDADLFDKLDAMAYMERFALNHIKSEHKENFSKSMTSLSELTKSVVQSMSDEGLSQKEKHSLVDHLMKSEEQLRNDYNSDKYFPDKNFLHRYMSFLKADYLLLSDIVKEKINTTKSVFSYHSDVADEQFGHHYSGTKEEMTARSFEAYLEDKVGVGVLPLNAHSTLWYPKHAEREAINEMWADKLSDVSALLGSGYMPPKTDEVPQNLQAIILKNQSQSSMENLDFNSSPQTLSGNQSPVLNLLAKRQALLHPNESQHNHALVTPVSTLINHSASPTVPFIATTVTATQKLSDKIQKNREESHKKVKQKTHNQHH